MKNIYKTCAWNMRRTYKIALCTWAAMAILQTIVLLYFAKKGMQEASQNALLWMLFVLGYAAAVSASVLPGFIAAYGRGCQSFTVAGLPIRRSEILYGNILSGIIYAAATIAVQIFILIVTFYPVAALTQMRAEVIGKMAETGNELFIQTHAALFLQLIRNRVLVFIMPHTLSGALALIMLVLGTAVTLHCVLMHSKKARAISLGLCFVSACLGAGTMLIVNLTGRVGRSVMLFTGMTAQVLIISGSLFWALCDMNKAKNL